MNTKSLLQQQNTLLSNSYPAFTLVTSVASV